MKKRNALMELLFPRKCLLCRKLLKNAEADLCGSCRKDMEAYPAGKRNVQFLDSFAAVWYYEGSVRASLLRFKFYGARSYAAGYARFLARTVRETLPGGFDVLTWIPVSRRRKLRRGYDQVELMARALGRELDMPSVSAMKKIRHNPTQSGIADDAQRRANVLGAYRVTAPDKIAGKRVLLLDDILTSGATMAEAARVLKTAGAAEVHGLAVAAKK